MVYVDQFIAVLKVNGKVLREDNDIVHLPFGSDYSILLKNLCSKNASVKVSIDGKDVLDEHALIVRPNSESELKGFISNGKVSNSFRFIQKTNQISEHRGDNIDDGYIRIEFAYEKQMEAIRRTLLQDSYNSGSFDYRDQIRCAPRGMSFGKLNNAGSVYGSQSSSSIVEDSLSQPQSDEGITVKGAETSQNFRYSTIGELDEPKTIIIRLKGISLSGNIVEQPLTVTDKLECPTCGKKSKSDKKFCSECGTFIR